MTKDELLSLPPSIAIGIIYDASMNLQKVIATLEKPRGPLPPKFDRKLFRKEGYVYASESTLESLTFWLGRRRASASEGGQYADKDTKEALELERWVKWRSWYPDEAWSGTRGDTQVVADAPSKHPRVYSKDQPRRQMDVNARRPDYGDEFGPGDLGEGGADGIPF